MCNKIFDATGVALTIGTPVNVSVDFWVETCVPTDFADKSMLFILGGDPVKVDWSYTSPHPVCTRTPTIFALSDPNGLLTTITATSGTVFASASTVPSIYPVLLGI